MLEELEHELERVRAYGTDLPEPDDATVAAARLELMAAIGREPRVASARGRGWSTASRSRERLRKLQRRRRFALAGGLATAGVGVAGVLGFTTAATPVSALAAQMNQLARVAASQDWTGIPGPGQYLYTESTGLYVDGTAGNDNKMCAYSQVEHRQIWIATDGSGALDDTRDQSKFTSAADQATCAEMGITDPSKQDSSGNARFAAGGLSFPTNDWKSLSTDPTTLLGQIHAADGGPDDPAELFTNVADYMRESDVPPAIRGALYKAAALIPNVKLLGTQTDPTGQVGVAVGYPYANGQIHSELIFDQQTGRLLAEEYFDQTGKLSDWSSYTSQKIVDSVPSYPMESSGPSSTSSG
jgi:ribosome modulation factor